MHSLISRCLLLLSLALALLAPRAEPAAFPLNESCITGKVRDGEKNNMPIGGALVTVRNQATGDVVYSGRSNRKGVYSTGKLAPGLYSMRVTMEGFRSARFTDLRVAANRELKENVNLLYGTDPENRDLRITLSWCDETAGAVKDVDSYLAIPGVQGPLYYHVKAKDYFGCHLDVDDTSWSGPETTTAKAASLRPGRYVFYVNNYSDRAKPMALGKSNVKIQVYLGNDHVKTYRIPAGRGISYEVFHFEDGEIKDVGKYNDRLAIGGPTPR